MSKKCLLLALLACVCFADQAYSQLFSRFRSNYRSAPQQTYRFQGNGGYGNGYSASQYRNCPYGNGYASPNRTYQRVPHQAYRTVRPAGTAMQAVTVYDPRTGQRTARMVPVPQMALGQQPDTTGKPDQTAAAPTAAPARPSASQADIAKMATVEGSLDSSPDDARSLLAQESTGGGVAESGVKPASFDDNADDNADGAAANRIGTGGALEAGEFSVLDVGESSPSADEVSTDDASSVIELSAPEN